MVVTRDCYNSTIKIFDRTNGVVSRLIKSNKVIVVPNGETPNLVEQLHKPTLVLPSDCRPR